MPSAGRGWRIAEVAPLLLFTLIWLVAQTNLRYCVCFKCSQRKFAARLHKTVAERTFAKAAHFTCERRAWAWLLWVYGREPWRCNYSELQTKCSCVNAGSKNYFLN